MFVDKFNVHKYRSEIYKKFDENVSTKKICDWLKSLGDEYILNGDTIRKYKKRYKETKAVDNEVKKIKKEIGVETEIEEYLLETIAQCRVRKSKESVGGKDFQYYDQQMQNAIKLLQDLRGTSGKSVGLDEILEQIAKTIKDDEIDGGEATAGTDNKIS